MSYTTTMCLRDKFRPFDVSKVAAGRLFPALMLAIVLASAAVSPPAVASATLCTLTGTNEQTALVEAALPRSAVPCAPLPAECIERHDSCGPGAIPGVHAEPAVLGLRLRASFIAPRDPAPLRSLDLAPHAARSLSILFQNFRK